MNVLIAGGTGLIGRYLEQYLESRGHSVSILTRSPSKPNHVAWNPAIGMLDESEIQSTEVLINLCGEGIAEKRWTTKRKKELINSRTEPITFLFANKSKMPNLKHFISASGITCYGFEERGTPYVEDAPFGREFIDHIVEQWEEAADVFKAHVPVTKLRIAVVLSENGGALEKFLQTIRWNLGAPVGSGKQNVPWIHIEDLAGMFSHVMEKKLLGAYNAVTENASNKELTKSIARRIGKKIWLPPVPGFMIKLMFGEMADILLKGVKVSNSKIAESGFKPKYSKLQEALEALNLK